VSKSNGADDAVSDDDDGEKERNALEFSQTTTSMSQLDSAQLESLFPLIIDIYSLAIKGAKDNERLELAHQVNTPSLLRSSQQRDPSLCSPAHTDCLPQATKLRETLANLKSQAESIRGADMSLKEQETLIRLLERELEKRKGPSSLKTE
jgi:hypothetical protein